MTGEGICQSESGVLPLSSLLDLGEDPRLNQSTSRDHDAVDSRCVDVVLVVRVAVAVASSKDGDRGQVGLLDCLAQNVDALPDVLPVGEPRVPLLSRPPVDCHSVGHPLGGESRDELVGVGLVVLDSGTLKGRREDGQRRGRQG